MLWRLAARALTGPVAFLVAGIADLVVFATRALARWLVRSARASPR